jgi:glycosyltransferase involved in cell wall biosynthesis
MDILCFADTRFPIERANGVQTMATCHALAARGHRVTLMVRPDIEVPRRDPFTFYGLASLPTLGIETVDGPSTPRARRARFLVAAVRRLVRSRTETVYTRDLGVAAFLLQLPRSRRPPVVYESHGLAVRVSEEMPTLLGKPELRPSARKLSRLDRRERRVWRRADAYVTITEALCDELTSRYGPRTRVFVVPDGARLHAGEPPASGGAVAGYAGHLYPWKGVDVLVRALALTPGVEGLIVGGHPGEADRARIEALARDLGVLDRIAFTGLVSPPDVRSRLASASMLILPNARSTISERYTSPLKLFEYLSMGRPIIASNLAAIREVLTDGETALLVPPGDPQALADAMRRVASDAALAASLGRAALALAPEYTWERRATRLEQALAAAVAS